MVRNTKTADTDIASVVEKLRPLLQHESDAKWEIGDYLVTVSLTSGELARVAAEVQHEVSTLKSYRQVSEEFPENRRDRSLPWGVFKHLTRIPDENWQDQFLTDNPRPTAGDAERAAAIKAREMRGSRTGGRDVYRDTATVNEISTILEVQPAAQVGRVTLTGVSEAEFRHNEFLGTFEIEFKLA